MYENVEGSKEGNREMGKHRYEKCDVPHHTVGTSHTAVRHMNTPAAEPAVSTSATLLIPHT